MSVALYALPSNRPPDWLEELAALVQRWDQLPTAAQEAVRGVVASIRADPATSAVERAYAAQLLPD